MRDLTNELIDEFVGVGRVRVQQRGSRSRCRAPCSSACSGSRYDDLDLFLEFKDGIIRRPGRTDDAMRRRARARPGSEIYEYFEKVLDEREVERRDDLLQQFLDAEVDGHRLTRRRHPRHLLPVPARGARHRHRVARLHGRRTSRSTPSSAAARRRPVARPRRGRGAAALGDAGAGRAARARPRTSRSRASSSWRASGSPCLLGSANIDAQRVPRAGERRLRAARPTATSRSAAASTAAWGRTSPASSCGSRWRRCTGASPTTRIKPGETPQYTMGIRAVEHLPLVFTPPTRGMKVRGRRRARASGTAAATCSRPRCSRPTTAATAWSRSPRSRPSSRSKARVGEENCPERAIILEG